jgi:putative DNA primase/helicase
MTVHARDIGINAIIEQFRDAMAAAGVPYSGPIDTDVGDIKRFTVEGDRKSALTGWYALYTDGVPAGSFGCWKRGVSATWCYKATTEITPAEREQIERRRRETDEARKKAEAERHAKAQEQAAIIWEAAKTCEDHPYLTRKGVKSYGLRVGRWTRVNEDTGEIWVDEPNTLLVPMRDGKKIASLQAIFPDKNNPTTRDKDFLPGGKKRGCFFSIGKPREGVERPTVYICEGYATGATIHEATGDAVVVAFDAGNLVKVAERVRGQLPRAHLVIAADNDRWTLRPMENPGVHFAKAAAREVGASLVIPEFRDLSTSPTDFNDLHALEGLGAVLAQIQPKPAAEPPKAPAANDNSPAASDSREVSTQVAVDWHAPFPDVNGKGRPISTIENVAEACRRLAITVRYNVIKKDLEILIPGESFSIDNRANASLAWVESACNRFGIPNGQLGGFLGYLADKNLHNPVANWITSRPWDGTTRLQAFYNTIRADGEEDDYRIWDLKAAMMRRWMISAVAAAFNPYGVSAHGVLVLQGDQYLGKTKWFKTLVPAELGVIADGLSLRTDDKDNVKQIVSNWLVELGELDATFRKSDIAQLKAFLTRDRDVLRRPYAKLESEYARRTVFFASVNPRQYLHDPTGNRRYWTISATEINHSHQLDMQQVWAEFYEAHYLKGETWYLSPEEMGALNDHNRDHEVLDPIRERIMSRLDWDGADTLQWRWMTATDVMTEIGFDRPTRADVTHCGLILQELNGKRRKIVRGKSLALVPPRLERGPYTR